MIHFYVCIHFKILLPLLNLIFGTITYFETYVVGSFYVNNIITSVVVVLYILFFFDISISNKC